MVFFFLSYSTTPSLHGMQFSLLSLYLFPPPPFVFNPSNFCIWYLIFSHMGMHLSQCHLFKSLISPLSVTYQVLIYLFLQNSSVSLAWPHQDCLIIVVLQLSPAILCDRNSHPPLYSVDLECPPKARVLRVWSSSIDNPLMH